MSHKLDFHGIYQCSIIVDKRKLEKVEKNRKGVILRMGGAQPCAMMTLHISSFDVPTTLINPVIASYSRIPSIQWFRIASKMNFLDPFWIDVIERNRLGYCLFAKTV